MTKTPICLTPFSQLLISVGVVEDLDVVVVNEILPDPLRVEGQLQLALDELAVGLTPALMSSPSSSLRLFGAGAAVCVRPSHLLCLMASPDGCV